MNTNIQISLEEPLLAERVKAGSPLGLEPAQVIPQALLAWLKRHDRQRASSRNGLPRSNKILMMRVGLKTGSKRKPGRKPETR